MPYQRTARGQTLVEFALIVPLLLLVVLGLIQVSLLYFTNSSLTQAATDAAHTVAAQSSSGPLDMNGASDSTQYQASWMADGPALDRLQSAMASQNLNNLQEVDIFPADKNGKPVRVTITSSQDWRNPTGSQTFLLENQYGLTPPPDGPICPVGAFYLLNSLGGAGSVFSAWDQTVGSAPAQCVLPWNGSQYSYATNQNGRDDQRCAEPTAYVRLTYRYSPLFYPLIPKVTLAAGDGMPLEPRQFTQSITSQQDIICSQFPLFGQ